MGYDIELSIGREDIYPIREHPHPSWPAGVIFLLDLFLGRFETFLLSTGDEDISIGYPTIALEVLWRVEGFSRQ